MKFPPVSFDELPSPAAEPNRDCSILIFCGRLVVTPLDQLRLRLPNHEFVRLMEAAAPIAVSERDAFFKEVAAELGQHAR